MNDITNEIIKSSVQNIEAYHVPKNEDIENDYIKLNQNESPFDLTIEMKEKILDKLKNESWNRYPSIKPMGLIKKIANYSNFNENGITIANGSNEILEMIFLATCNKGDKILTLNPTFPVYKRLASIMELDLIELGFLNNYKYDLDSLNANAKDAKLIVISNPNSPTGTILSLNEIEEIVKASNCLVVIDEAYYEFSKITAKDLIEKYDNVVIVRTFSKALGLAGLRLGYILGKPNYIEQIEKTKLPFSVGIFQNIACNIALDNNLLFNKTIEEIITERKRMFDFLSSKADLKVIESYSNFILIELLNHKVKDLFDYLYENKIIIRSFDNPIINNAIRLTIGTSSENDVFTKYLSLFLKGKDNEN